MNSELQTFECRKCKQVLDLKEKDNHELICLYSLQVRADEISDIPCETCGESIPFDSYAMHINMCGMDQSFINDIISNINSQSTYDRYSNRFVPPSERTEPTEEEDTIPINESPEPYQNEQNLSESDEEYELNSEFLIEAPQIDLDDDEEVLADIRARTEEISKYYATTDEMEIDSANDIENPETVPTRNEETSIPNEETSEPKGENTDVEMDNTRDDDSLSGPANIQRYITDYLNSFNNIYSATPNLNPSEVAYEGSIGNFGSSIYEGSTVNQTEEPVIDDKRIGVKVNVTDNQNTGENEPVKKQKTEDVKNEEDDGEDNEDDEKYEEKMKPIEPKFYAPPNIHMRIPGTINRRNAFSGPSPVVEEDDPDFPKLPNTINSNHTTQFGNLKSSIGYTLHQTIFYQPRRFQSNFPSRFVGHNTYYRPSGGLISDELKNMLPPDLQGFIDVANAGHRQRIDAYRNRRQRMQSPEESYEYLKDLTEKVGVVEIGVSNVDSVAPIVELTKDQCCAICQEDLPMGAKARHVICGHDTVFCDGCIVKWLSKNKKCPVCMNNLEDVYNEISNKVIDLSDDETDLFETSPDMTVTAV